MAVVTQRKCDIGVPVGQTEKKYPWKKYLSEIWFILSKVLILSSQIPLTLIRFSVLSGQRFWPHWKQDKPVFTIQQVDG